MHPHIFAGSYEKSFDHCIRETRTTSYQSLITAGSMKRRRIALFNGACGTARRIVIQGQVADVTLASFPSRSEYPLLALGGKQTKTIRPVVDFGLPGIRKPVLILEILDHPGRNIDREDLSQARVIIRSPVIKGGKDSFFTWTPDTDIQAGHYMVRAVLIGHGSLRQKILDLRRQNKDERELRRKGRYIGYGKVRILPNNYSDLLITSDIDQTFLDTDIKTKFGLIQTLFESPVQKTPLPGMVELYKSFRLNRKDPMPLIFVSASPHFFRRTLQAFFFHHEIDFTGLSLKPFMTQFEFLFRRFMRSLSNPEEFFAAKIVRIAESLSRFRKHKMKKLSNQVAYKLVILLTNRLMHPTHVKEILMGDNTESDYFIFVLYQVLLAGKIPPDRLEEFLDSLQFKEHDPLNQEQQKLVKKLTEQNLKIHGSVNPVIGAWVNQAYKNPNAERIDLTIRENLLYVNSYDDPEIKQIVLCEGAIGFALAAMDLGILKAEDLQNIWTSMDGKKGLQGLWTGERLYNSVRDFPFKKSGLRKSLLRKLKN